MNKNELQTNNTQLAEHNALLLSALETITNLPNRTPGSAVEPVVVNGVLVFDESVSVEGGVLSWEK